MLLLNFTVHLDNHEIDQLVRPEGPLFHKWLPNGRADAIVVPTSDDRNRLELWFERRGYLSESFIRYDKKRNEVDVEVMKRQDHLDAGQLWGECQYAHVTTAELKAVREDKESAEEYVELAKRIVKFLHAPVSAFIDLLRTQYGQYWLPELPSWDSRTQSIGSYCATTLWLEWREKADQPWRKFRPTQLSHTLTIQPLPGRAGEEYLTEEDWRRIQQTFSPVESVPLALRLLGRAHELRDAGHESEAFVQAATAAEVAVEHFLATRTKNLPEDADSAVRQLLKLPLKSQVSILATSIASISQAVLDDALKAIDARNAIVHEGTKPYDPGRKTFLALLDCAKALLDLEELKTPVLYAGNELSPP